MKKAGRRGQSLRARKAPQEDAAGLKMYYLSIFSFCGRHRLRMQAERQLGTPGHQRAAALFLGCLGGFGGFGGFPAGAGCRGFLRCCVGLAGFGGLGGSGGFCSGLGRRRGVGQLLARNRHPFINHDIAYNSVLGVVGVKINSEIVGGEYKDFTGV